MTTDATTFDDAEDLPLRRRSGMVPATAACTATGEPRRRGRRLSGSSSMWATGSTRFSSKKRGRHLRARNSSFTFVLVLIACWIVTIGVVAFIGPRIYYSADGGTLLGWYFMILCLPLMVVVPLAAFRSLTAEREDNTYDLLSITTLKPRQIISGKLGSSVAQMAVYFSAITPCLAFTYLLRGVDLPTIASLLFYTFFWSLGLSMVGILLATLTPQRFVQVFILVAFVAGLFLNLYLAISLGWMAAYYGRSVIGGAGNAFWIFTSIVATFYGTFFALAYFAAAGMITFTSENRSSPLRICMIVQQAAFIGWMAYAWIESQFEAGMLVATAAIGAVYWYAMGTLLTAERPGMSHRVRRRLPQSLMGRMFFSWLNPGPASGYMFVVANASALVVILTIGEFISSMYSPRSSPSFDVVEYLLVIGWSYLVVYLGIGLLLVTALRRVATVTMLACVLIQLLLLLAGFGVPYAIKSMSLALRDVDYTMLQITDPFSTMAHIANGGVLTDGDVIAMIVTGVALCVLLVNMPAVIRELRVVREAAPVRVCRRRDRAEPTARSAAAESVGGVRVRGSGFRVQEDRKRARLAR